MSVVTKVTVDDCSVEDVAFSTYLIIKYDQFCSLHVKGEAKNNLDFWILGRVLSNLAAYKHLLCVRCPL